MAKKHFIAIDHRRLQGSQPIEVIAAQLAVIPALGCTLVSKIQLDQPSVLIALNGGKVPLDQQIGCSSRFERPADVIPQVHDLRDADGGYIREHCFKRDAVAMNISDCSKFHRPTSLIGWPTTTVMREYSGAARFSCICKSARKLIVKSALTIDVAGRMRARKDRGQTVLRLRPRVDSDRRTLFRITPNSGHKST